MIKAVITDADTPLGGELLRLLINHPDVDIHGLVSTSHVGESADSVHHGLIGERPMRFRRDVPTGVDVLFICGANGREVAVKLLPDTKTKVIDLSREAYMTVRGNAVPAISEIFRKPLVRGAREARVLSPMETVLLISLFPLARHLLLGNDLKVEVSASRQVLEDMNPARAGELAAGLLRSIQQSFEHNVEFNMVADESTHRGMRIRTTLQLAMPVKDLRPLYDDVYDDHNFTFLTSLPLDYKQVTGTNKCLISLHRSDDGILTVEAVADARMRGWAGEAVLAMNLMFGLYERTGLQLKASEY